MIRRSPRCGRSGAGRGRSWSRSASSRRGLSSSDLQIFAYVVDTSYHAQNAARIIDLSREADTLFIEAVFLDEDREIAAQKHHLTAAQAGSLARRAGVNRVVPFHFSPRYRDREDRLRREVEDAFVGRIGADGGR